MVKKPKTTNALMKYLRDKKGISISGPLQKRKLRNIGYFHGYKGYRFCNSPNNLLPINNFNEIQAIYNFDMRLKANMYSQIMFIETALKNYVLEELLKATGSIYFNDIYSKALTDYKSFPVGSKQYSAAVKGSLVLRNRIYASISRSYDDSFIVKHYYDKDTPIPIWAIFELITLGEFGSFIKCLDKSVRIEISKAVGINSAYDSDGKIVEQIIFLLRDLRNSIAHNSIIFDARFKSHSLPKRLMAYISTETLINNITFSTIVDYIITMAFILKKLNAPRSETLAFVKTFEKICEDFRLQVPVNIYSKVVYSDTKNKLSLLKKFI